MSHCFRCGTGTQHAHFMWDMFRAHLCDSVKQKLSDGNTHQAVIPGGCTSLVQPLDVSLNKPFKTNIRKLWTEWMVNGPKEFTKGGAMKRPSLALVAEWVVTAWDMVPEDMVVKSFKKCGISNSMDGEDDDALFADFVSDSTTSGQTCATDDSVDSDHELMSDTEMDDIYDDDSNDNDAFIHDILFGPSDEDFEGF